MAIEKLRQISLAENEALSIRRQAQTEARRIADDAKKRAVELKMQAAREAEEEYKKVIRAAEEEAEKAYGERLEEIRSECEALKKEASLRIPDAVNAIKGKVVNNIGNR